MNINQSKNGAPFYPSLTFHSFGIKSDERVQSKHIVNLKLNGSSCRTYSGPRPSGPTGLLEVHGKQVRQES
ncbi:hypothetical protein E2C01_002737 [Portunus trituberculatus]|uniref:Uncharacterized protein n=1 Tax=Portunus trituberculatus TaxID=210409 RepID=A0A5B7CM09_PORTR|nr:hypothetical protein [Portunus trituberculatus]